MNSGEGCGCIFGILLVAVWTFEIHPIVGCITTIACICFAVWAMENTAPLPKSPTVIRSEQTNNALPIKNVHVNSLQRLTITKNLFPAKKENSESFRQLLISHGIRYFYHFTDERNLDSIRKYGGLLSWKSCNTYGVEIPSAGGDTLSRQLDMRDNLQDYVRLSLCKDHPMIFRHKKEGKRLVLLKVKSEVALWKNTLFSNMNATDNNSFVGDNLEAFRKINFVAVRKTYVSRNDEDFKHHQAEILVKTVIPIEYIVNLDNPIYL